MKSIHNPISERDWCTSVVNTYVKLLKVKGTYNAECIYVFSFIVVTTYVKLLKKLLSKSFFVKDMFWVKVLFTELKTRNRLVSPHAIQRFVTNVKETF
ncbi:hypothetical protein EB1_12930 [Empedobacter brevis NBRC 14943 = ATCC 43319]|uniref:Uncharacterized protein n=1 Tax=Empedobacter brevis NBRC 14943 = ATCC 43319 TaxID=1218108 RepID=A0A511NF95_9FLAO|nr:hypothetical protein EB1_12930 [Empedobacter brevis NBRC 14943 = ATCC 43319]